MSEAKQENTYQRWGTAQFDIADSSSPLSAETQKWQFQVPGKRNVGNRRNVRAIVQCSLLLEQLGHPCSITILAIIPMLQILLKSQIKQTKGTICSRHPSFGVRVSPHPARKEGPTNGHRALHLLPRRRLHVDLERESLSQSFLVGSSKVLLECVV